MAKSPRLGHLLRRCAEWGFGWALAAGLYLLLIDITDLPELIAGAASFEGFKLYEDHQRSEGKVVNHQFAKELLAGFVGGEVDKLAETHGMNGQSFQHSYTVTSCMLMP